MTGTQPLGPSRVASHELYWQEAGVKECSWRLNPDTPVGDVNVLATRPKAHFQSLGFEVWRYSRQPLSLLSYLSLSLSVSILGNVKEGRVAFRCTIMCLAQSRCLGKLVENGMTN